MSYLSNYDKAGKSFRTNHASLVTNHNSIIKWFKKKYMNFAETNELLKHFLNLLTNFSSLHNSTVSWMLLFEEPISVFPLLWFNPRLCSLSQLVLMCGLFSEFESFVSALFSFSSSLQYVYILCLKKYCRNCCVWGKYYKDLKLYQIWLNF